MTIERFAELITKKDRTCPECAEALSLAFKYKRYFYGIESVNIEIEKCLKVCSDAFAEIIKDDYDENGKYIPHHPYHIDYYSTAEGTLANKLKS